MKNFIFKEYKFVCEAIIHITIYLTHIKHMRTHKKDLQLILNKNSLMIGVL